MTRWLVVLLAIMALGATGAPAADAHGIGQRYDLPVPLWLYLYGAAAAVVVSFVLIGMFVGEKSAGRLYPRFELSRIPWLHAVLTSAPLHAAAKLLSGSLFVLVLAAGLFGTQSVNLNFAPTFVWVVWWVGLGFFTALVGNIWPVINPWKIVFDGVDALVRRARRPGGLELHEPYPERLGVWPALLLFAAFVWLENVSGGAPDPGSLAVAVIGYSAVTWLGMSVFGRDVWLRNGEAFSVIFEILGRFAPSEARVVDRSICADCSASCAAQDECVGCEECLAFAERGVIRLSLRPWGAGLLRAAPISADRVAFVVFMLASVTFDGLSATAAWQDLYFSLRPVLLRAGLNDVRIFQSFGLIAVPLAFAALYTAAMRLTGLERVARLAGGPAVRVAGRFVYSLVPIAIAYQIAHYAMLLVSSGWIIVPLLSDPFGWGWDLFGTARFSIEPILNAALVWYFQVGAIIAGHVIAVYLAHAIALRVVRDGPSAARSQLPLLVLMVAYTVSSLWILSQDVVEESQLGSALPRMFVLG